MDFPAVLRASYCYGCVSQLLIFILQLYVHHTTSLKLRSYETYLQQVFTKIIIRHYPLLIFQSVLLPHNLYCYMHTTSKVNEINCRSLWYILKVAWQASQGKKHCSVHSIWKDTHVNVHRLAVSSFTKFWKAAKCSTVDSTD